MTFYKDYFGIRPDYAPCMTLADINKTPETWLGFYPHDSFVEILRELLKSLNGGNKTLWITGAYGTGKSHASLVLQKLFTDDEARVQKWLDLRKAQIPDPVRKGMLERRGEKTLVVYDVNADGVDAKNQFLMRLQRGITKALEAGGHTIPLKGKLDEVIERIRQDEPHFFAKRDEMQARLSHLNAGIKTADALEKKLRDANLEAGLVSDAMRVLEARHIYLGLSAEDFLAWVDASLKANGLSKLVYIWDEFSAFMDRNRSELKTLEQLAEAAQQGRFYFVPVTHTDISSYVAAGSESAKKANDRFTFKRLDLPNETALKLAADAFVVKPEKATEWTQERDVLWHSVNGVAENYMVVNKAGIDAADFKGILPLHPMAAFLLKHLSVAIGANQRSMFEFLNGEEFRAFIEKGGLDVSGHQFLTVDHLWRYFVERDDLGTGQAVQEARAEYARREKDLQPDERRVFKAVLLFGLIEQMQGTGHPLLSATVENIQRSFEGDGALQGVDAILRNLEQKHCFTIVNGRCERFRDRSDTKEIEEKKAALDGKFGDLVLKDTETELVKQLKGVNYGGRFDVRAAGVDGLSASSIAKRESFGDDGNRVLVQFILARDEQEQLRIPEKAKELAKQFKDHRMLFVTLPEVSFCRDNAKAWEEFTENSARLALASDSASKKVFETQVSSAKAAWHSKVTSAAKLIVYKPNPNGEPFAEEVTWGQLKKRLAHRLCETDVRGIYGRSVRLQHQCVRRAERLAELGTGGHGVRQVLSIQKPRRVEDRGGDVAEERRHWRGNMVRRESEPSADAVTGFLQETAGQHGGRGQHLLHTQTLHRPAATAVRTAGGAAFGLRAGLRAENMVDRTAQTAMDGRRDKQGAGRSDAGGNHRGGGERRRRQRHQERETDLSPVERGKGVHRTEQRDFREQSACGRNGGGGVERGRDTAGTDFAARSAVGATGVYPCASRAERGGDGQSHRRAVRGKQHQFQRRHRDSRQ